MPTRDVVVIGASAGGVEALQRFVAGLPPNFPGYIFIVLHLWPRSPSALPAILNRAGSLTASNPVDGATAEPGHVYVAPPDLHMLLERGAIRLVRGPKENRHRPAIDPLFRSAALAYGPRTVGVVLTGSLDDGTAGLFAIKRAGGIAVVQHPSDAAYTGMPTHAIQNVPVDHILPLSDIPNLLVKLAGQSVPALPPHTRDREDIKDEVEFARSSPEMVRSEEHHLGEPAEFACPECHGALWQIKDGKILRYRCRIGHAYTSASLTSEMSDTTENALWVALRAVEELGALHARLAARAELQDLPRVFEHHSAAVQRHRESADSLRALLMRGLTRAEEEREEQSP